MTLQVYTARMGYRGPLPWLDITRKSAGPDGIAFAPSMRLLARTLWARKHVEGLREFGCEPQAASYERGSWEEYQREYIAEMRDSYRTARQAWDALLARDVVVLLCFCGEQHTRHRRCHRFLLADILEKLGATNQGEIAPVARST